MSRPGPARRQEHPTPGRRPALHIVASVAQLVLAVELEAEDGRRWHTIGGGDTLEEALAFARDSCPDGADWRVVRWGDLYGD